MHCFFCQIKLQESPEDMPAGQTPYTIILFAHNDLVDKVQPGDRVNITGKEKEIDSLLLFITWGWATTKMHWEKQGDGQAGGHDML